MPAIYYRHGMHFLYPENWELEESDPIIRSPSWTDYAVTLSTPGGGFWSAVRYEPGTDPQTYVEGLLRMMQEEYSDMDVEVHKSELAGYAVDGYELNWVYLDLTSTAMIYGIRTPRATWVVYFQAEDREYEAVKDVFQAITVSLLQEKT